MASLPSSLDGAHRPLGGNPLYTPSTTPQNLKSTPPVGSGTAGGSQNQQIQTNESLPINTNTPEYAAITASVLATIGSGPAAMSSDAIDVILAEVTMKMKQLESTSDNDKVTTDTDSQRAAMEAKIEKLKEATKKIEDAIYQAQHESIWDKIKIAFEALGAVLAIVVGAILIATGVGAVAGGLLIAAGVVGVVMTIDDIVKQCTPDHLGIMGSIVKSCGGSEEQAEKADMGFEIALAVAAVLLSVASIAEGGFGMVTSLMNLAKAGEAAGEATATVVTTAEKIESITEDGMSVANTAEKVASDTEEAESVANDAQEEANAGAKFATRVQSVSNWINAGNSVVTAGGDIYAGVLQYDSTMDQAGAKKLQADAKMMDAISQDLDAIIQLALNMMKQHMDAWDNCFDAITSRMNDHGKDMATHKFST
jgi:transloator